MGSIKSKTISFRATGEIYFQIKHLSEKYSVPDSQILRWALDAIVSLDKTSKSLSLPISFSFVNDAINDLKEQYDHDAESFEGIVRLAKMFLQTEGQRTIPATTHHTDGTIEKIWLRERIDNYTGVKSAYGLGELDGREPDFINFEIDEKIRQKLVKFVDEGMQDSTTIKTLISLYGEDYISKSLNSVQFWKNTNDYMESEAEKMRESVRAWRDSGNFEEGMFMPDPRDTKYYDYPLLYAAAGSPIEGDQHDYSTPTHYGDGYIAVMACGNSMEPLIDNEETVLMRLKESLERPVLKTGEIYLFNILGARALKEYNSREATLDEINANENYIYESTKGEKKVKILRSLNPIYPEIIIDSDDFDWIAWLDKSNYKTCGS